MDAVLEMDPQDREKIIGRPEEFVVRAAIGSALKYHELISSADAADVQSWRDFDLAAGLAAVARAAGAEIGQLLEDRANSYRREGMERFPEYEEKIVDLYESALNGEFDPHMTAGITANYANPDYCPLRTVEA